MQRIRILALSAAFALGLAALANAEGVGLPSSPDALFKAMAAAGKPGPEHRKLEPFVGEWDVTLRAWMDPSQPPAELRGTLERKWILGGRFVQETLRGEFDGQPVEGLGLLGYDNGRKKFTTVRACGLSGTLTTGLSDCDASGTKFVCATEERCPLTGEQVAGRDEVIVESDDRIVTNVYKTLGGKEVKAMEIVTTRR